MELSAGLGYTTRIAGSNEWATQALRECGDGGFLKHGVWPAASGHVQVRHSSLLSLVRTRSTLRWTLAVSRIRWPERGTSGRWQASLARLRLCHPRDGEST